MFGAQTMTQASDHHVTKVPAVTLGFWIIKILATHWAKRAATRSA
jgi:uncharacterized membrane-anchored protein